MVPFRFQVRMLSRAGRRTDQRNSPTKQTNETDQRNRAPNEKAPGGRFSKWSVVSKSSSGVCSRRLRRQPSGRILQAEVQTLSHAPAVLAWLAQQSGLLAGRHAT